MAPGTLLGVYAHPDDECTCAGGVLGRHSDIGVRTILVSCTNGEFGDDVDGAKPGSPEHDAHRVAATRHQELEAAGRVLGLSTIERLGYHDSGMPGWARFATATVFSEVPVHDVAERIGELLDRYQPDVVLTHNPDAAHEHPDHRHAARATALALEGRQATLYFGGHGAMRAARLREALGRNGIHRPQPDAEHRRVLELIESRITHRVDLGADVLRKRKALFEHASQLVSSAAAQLSAGQYAEVFATETFIRVQGDIEL
jgi:LmbE family N-acetylglucosaminyl deacetylase